jgi:5-methylcytosine-specific restriction endonuclease McrA
VGSKYVNKGLRAQLFWRSQGYCERCGGHIDQAEFAAHHRKLRAQGGQDTIQNLVALCHQCHNLGTNSVHLNVAVAIENGFIVPSWANESETLICPNDQIKLLLNTDGTKTPE